MLDYDEVATETQAHSEWHRNTGQKYGCPWDCCEPPEPEHCPVCDYEYLDDDGVCPRAADDPDHDLRMADYLSSRLRDVAPDPEEVKSDPWF